MNARLKFLLAAVLLAGAAIFLQARSHNEVFPPRQPLASMPHQLGGWVGADLSIPPDVLGVLGRGDFLLRAYRQEGAEQPYVDLFVAYFPSQRAGDTIHSPKNCLPGSGWSPTESSRFTVSLPGHDPFPVNRYVIAKGAMRQLVLYWYWSHNRAVASEYWAKLYLVTDSVRLNRSDGSLVRVTTPLETGESPDAAQTRLLSFAGNVVPVLNQYIPQ
jgi:EpsI family protein